MSIYYRSRYGLMRAYTLIEMLIVVALLGIAGALLIPHLVHQDNLTAQSAVRLLIADLSFAQSDSLANQEFRRVQFMQDINGIGIGYCIVRIAEAGPELSPVAGCVPPVWRAGFGPPLCRRSESSTIHPEPDQRPPPVRWPRRSVAG